LLTSYCADNNQSLIINVLELSKITLLIWIVDFQLCCILFITNQLNTHVGTNLKISDYPDAELISQCIAGQQPAWEELIARYEKLIYSTALRTGLDHFEADEIFQNVCMIWLKELSHLRQSNSLGAWLVTTTRRECWALWRHDKAKLEELDEKLASDELPEELAQHLEDAQKVQSAFKQLAEPCHQLLWRLYFNEENTSYAEIARDLNIPPNSIGPTRSRCLEKLKSILISKNF